MTRCQSQTVTPCPQWFPNGFQMVGELLLILRRVAGQDFCGPGESLRKAQLNTNCNEIFTMASAASSAYSVTLVTTGFSARVNIA